MDNGGNHSFLAPSRPDDSKNCESRRELGPFRHERRVFRENGRTENGNHRFGTFLNSTKEDGEWEPGLKTPKNTDSRPFGLTVTTYLLITVTGPLSLLLV